MQNTLCTSLVPEAMYSLPASSTTGGISTAGVVSVVDTPLIQTVLVVLEGILLAIFLALIRPGKCKREQLIGGCAIALADVHFLIDVAWSIAL
ncbi:hypothetical protein [Collinsella intestinalis]|uniref:hypothetical protein n=1 Tax=Collinsella intestinalis TaxID=147207 RepID=UPI00195F1711|nr:hypothetical protein [Collinsella intestinalis]MBM6907381.1 hypothetical protein [Collinsella intestinalis]